MNKKMFNDGFHTIDTSDDGTGECFDSDEIDYEAMNEREHQIQCRNTAIFLAKELLSTRGVVRTENLIDEADKIADYLLNGKKPVVKDTTV